MAQLRNNQLDIYLHPGQIQANESRARFIVVTAGTQGGKTSYGPYWLLREIRLRGPGDYLIVTPTFQLLERKLLTEFNRLFSQRLRLGRYHSSPTRIFRFSDAGERRMHPQRYDPAVRTTVQFGYADNPDSLESMTAKAAWCDEAGQKKFKLEAWHAILRRLSLAQGRVLITTSVYAPHWLKHLVDASNGGDKSIDVIRFDSVQNPAFPLEEYQRAQRDLPRWKFNMLYRGMFEKPAGLIYDCIDTATQRFPRFTIPTAWRRFLGLDFGAQNMAATFWAEEPDTKKLYCYRTYHAAGESAQGHVRRILHGEHGLPHSVGGSPSEDEWRAEFRRAGLPVRRPKISDVEVGITRVYGAWQRGELYAFDDLTEFWQELTTYSRVLNEHGEPTEKIEDKETFHLLDSMRYIISDYKRGAGDHRTLIIQAPDPLIAIDRSGF